MVRTVDDYPDILMLAIDHRSSLRKRIAIIQGIAEPNLVALKLPVIRAGAEVALERETGTGAISVLVDRQSAKASTFVADTASVDVALAIEASGQDELALEATPQQLVEDLQQSGARWAKVLIRWNPLDDADKKARQQEVLHQCSAVAHGAGVETLLEVIVPTAAADLADAKSDPSQYKQQVLPRRVCDAVAELSLVMAPQLWKVQGTSRDDLAAAIAAASTQSTPTRIVVLGGGGSSADLEPVFAAAARYDQYVGFAVGRTIWANEVECLAAGDASAAEVAASTKHNLRLLIEMWEHARSQALR